MITIPDVLCHKHTVKLQTTNTNEQTTNKENRNTQPLASLLEELLVQQELYQTPAELLSVFLRYCRPALAVRSATGDVHVRLLGEVADSSA